ncbi:hypothetical protein DPMN_025533 [Dreissena polymorpha]|uniref:Uncharacterized protein n=1 Tax=Dreissena polymorpha TaxID=45954 RepID=A0A9D4LRI4_DREPO|nr:hypothetical protein DPMN_025533 [Dreissena polymorpha]
MKPTEDKRNVQHSKISKAVSGDAAFLRSPPSDMCAASQYQCSLRNSRKDLYSEAL